MTTTGLVLDPRFQRHDTGPQHPERPARIEAIIKALTDAGLADRCKRIGPKPAALSHIQWLHSPGYIQRVEAACRQNAPFIDTVDSAICPESYDIALLAAGATIAATDAVMNGELNNAFCAVRPPGHHAERDVSLGFCLFNNIAIAAARLLHTHGLDRVMVIDWDVHHCNGTQHSFEASNQVFVCSLHGHPSYVYPGTGFDEETGTGEGRGYTLNIPMMPGTTGGAYRQAFDEQVLPAAERFDPQFVLISAGFDAHRLDPLAPICLENEDFEWMTRAVLDLAARHCDGKLVSVLEGGYHLGALADCTTLHLSLLMGDGNGQ